ncbi:ferredoxin family protein [Myxococcota bacterium]|nr:ferredoxin family protein [Myxococcota bacterium]
MAYVVAEPCINCKYTDCVDVCPVDCFREGVNMLVIDPDECIDCGVCEPECPAEAIFEIDDLPEKWAQYAGINAKYAKEWPEIDESKDAMDAADEWAEREGKDDLLDPTPAGR